MSARLRSGGIRSQPTARVWLSFGLGAGALTTACTVESVSEVVVATVRVEPATAAVAVGGEVHFSAVVADEAGVALGAAAVTWSSDAPEIVSVDDRGVGRALSDGVATVEAAFLDVTGSSTIVVLPPPRVELDPDVLWLVRGTDARVPPSPVGVARGGAGTLGHLTTDVRYESGEPTGWLGARLALATAPTTLTVTVDLAGLASGVHDATVHVTSDAVGVAAAVLPVRLTLAGFTILVPADGVTVVEGRTADGFDVVLDVEPTDDVVLSVGGVESGMITVKPSRLTFTPKNWSSRRTVEVTGIDDVDLNGDRTALVVVSVDAEPGAAYAAVEDQFVEITVLDDDVAGLALTETGKGTSAREDQDPDTIKVMLTARPRSQVVLTVSSDDPSDATVSPGRLTFTRATWNVQQSIAFTAVDDGVRDGTRTRTVTVAVRGAESDPAYRGLSRSIQATTFDRKKDDR